MLVRALRLNLLGEAASLLLGFVGSILLARLLGPADRGLLALMLSVVTFTYALVSLGLPISVEYHAKRAAAGALVGNTLAYAAALAALLVPAFWFLREPIADMFARGGGGETWVLVGVLVPLTFLQWTSANQLSGDLRFGAFNALFAASRAMYLIVVILLLTVAGLGVSAGLLATIAGSLVMIAGGLGILLRGAELRFDRGLLKNLARYGARLQVGSLFQLLGTRLDLFVLQLFRPLSQVGYYVVAQVVAELVTRLASAFQSSVLPLVASETQGDRQSRTTAVALRHHGILAGAGIVAIAIFGPLLILFGFGSEFGPAIVPMLILLPGLWFLGAGTVVVADLSGRGRPGTASLLSAVTVVVTVALDFALIPPFGVRGAAIASTLAYASFGIASAVVLARIANVRLRELIVPTRHDLARYPEAVRALRRRRRPVSTDLMETPL
jgi:O-antigen/teichoic acid export membrane protein